MKRWGGIVRTGTRRSQMKRGRACWGGRLCETRCRWNACSGRRQATRSWRSGAGCGGRCESRCCGSSCSGCRQAGRCRRGEIGGPRHGAMGSLRPDRRRSGQIGRPSRAQRLRPGRLGHGGALIFCGTCCRGKGERADHQKKCESLHGKMPRAFKVTTDISVGADRGYLRERPRAAATR